MLRSRKKNICRVTGGGTAALVLLLAFLHWPRAGAQPGMVEVVPTPYDKALRNPMKGLTTRRIHDHPWATLAHSYIRWNEIENDESDGIKKIRSVTEKKWGNIASRNIKVIPRVYLDWNGKFWPADMTPDDYTSEQFKHRVVRLVERLSILWDNDPRVVSGTGVLDISETGDVTVRNFTNSVLLGVGADSNGTVNLNGGSLRARYVRGGAGTSTFNFNGGTLIATHFLTDYFGELTEANILAGGALIDTNGNNVTIAQDLQGAGGLTKLGTGILTLGGTNTYAAGTTINGGELALGGNGALADSDVVISDGALRLSADLEISAGTLTVNSAGSAIILGNNATLAFEGSSLVPWPEDGALSIIGSFTAGSSIRFGTNSGGLTPAQLSVITVNGGGTYTLNETGFLIEGSAPGGYAQWASANAPTGDADDDFDDDGVSNAVEYVLGGSKDTNDLESLPEATVSGGNLVIQFVRDQDSIDGSSAAQIEVGTDLVNWPGTYNVGADTGSSSSGVEVAKGNPVAGKDTITVTVTQNPDAKKFARLKVTVTP
jgi:autotransporter-associated beta strand protein